LRLCSRWVPAVSFSRASLRSPDYHMPVLGGVLSVPGRKRYFSKSSWSICDTVQGFSLIKSRQQCLISQNLVAQRVSRSTGTTSTTHRMSGGYTSHSSGQCGRTETARRGLAIAPWYSCCEDQSWWVSQAERAIALPNPAIGPQVVFQAMMSAE
jgi:hypothetical protein